MKTATFTTTGMHCPSCSMLVEMDVADLEGVESVKASHVTSSTEVTFDETKVDTSRIEAAIRGAGYEAMLVS